MRVVHVFFFYWGMKIIYKYCNQRLWSKLYNKNKITFNYYWYCFFFLSFYWWPLLRQPLFSTNHYLQFLSFLKFWWDPFLPCPPIFVSVDPWYFSVQSFCKNIFIYFYCWYKKNYLYLIWSIWCIIQTLFHEYLLLLVLNR